MLNVSPEYSFKSFHTIVTAKNGPCKDLRMSFKFRFVSKLRRAYIACKYYLLWLFLAGFLMSTFIVSMFNFCGIPMHLLPSR